MRPIQPQGPPRDMMEVYLRQIGNVPLLTAGQEIALAREIEQARLALRRALAAVPAAAGPLAEVGRVATLPLKDAVLGRVVAEVRIRTGHGNGHGPGPGRAGASLRRLESCERALREAKRRLAEANLRLVVSIARHYARTSVPLLDLIQEGNLGLLKAVERFQYRRGFRFSTYATWWIRQSILRAISEQARTIRLPTHVAETVGRLGRLTSVLASELGREPTAEELGHRARLDPSRVRLVLDAARPPLPLDVRLGDESELSDFLVDPTATLPTEHAESRDLTAHVERALAWLRPREREVLRLRFGLDGDRPCTLEDIGRRFAVTRERVRQIEATALRKLRQPARARPLAALAGRS